MTTLTNQAEIDAAFTKLCFDGKYQEAVTFTQHHKVSNYGYNVALFYAGKFNRVECAKFVLTSQELPIHADLSYLQNGAFTQAVVCFNWEMVDFLLLSPELKQHNSIHCNNSVLFKDLIRFSDIKNLHKYIHMPLVNIHIDDDSIFKYACIFKNLSVLNYLIFDYNIALTKAIKKHLKKDPTLFFIQEIFDKRNLSGKLERALPKKPARRHIAKI
jgi:hypothetical protein